MGRNGFFQKVTAALVLWPRSRTVMVNETECLLHLVKEKKYHEKGLWFGGNKYRMVRTDQESIAELETSIYFANRPKKGAVVIPTNTQIVVALYDEEQAASQNGGNCKKAAMAFAEYLIQSGY